MLSIEAQQAKFANRAAKDREIKIQRDGADD
jgi:hypothetical protein